MIDHLGSQRTCQPRSSSPAATVRAPPGSAGCWPRRTARCSSTRSSTSTIRSQDSSRRGSRTGSCTWTTTSADPTSSRCGARSRFDYDWADAARCLPSPRNALRAVRAYPRTRVEAGARPLLKDPIAVLSAPWLERTFGMQVVFSVRHPAAFAASLKTARLDVRLSQLHLAAPPHGRAAAVRPRTDLGLRGQTAPDPRPGRALVARSSTAVPWATWVVGTPGGCCGRPRAAHAERCTSSSA